MITLLLWGICPIITIVGGFYAFKEYVLHYINNRPKAFNTPEWAVIPTLVKFSEALGELGEFPFHWKRWVDAQYRQCYFEVLTEDDGTPEGFIRHHIWETYKLTVEQDILGLGDNPQEIIGIFNEEGIKREREE